MMSASRSLLIAWIWGLLAFAPASALEPTLLRESWNAGAEPGVTPCLLNQNRNGTCANYSWYNVCSGYIWIYNLGHNEAVGVLFGGDAQPCVRSGNVVKRVITYYRNLAPYYSFDHYDAYLDRDNQGDGCPDGVLAVNSQNDPGLRWNCWEVGLTLPAGLSHVIVRQKKSGTDPGPRLATDGPFAANCDPVGTQRSFWYGVNGSECTPWVGPTARNDNFLTWLIIDGEVPNSASASSWGKIKNLFR